MPFTLETTPPEILVEAFADLLSDRFVFTAQYSRDLDELIYNLPDDDLKAIALSITNWCQQRPEIFEALEQKISNKSLVQFISTTKPPLLNSFHPEDYRPQDYKTLLKNKLWESFAKSRE